MKNFSGSSPFGFKAEIRSTDTLDYRKGDSGYSLFTWKDDGTGVCLWREKHGLSLEDALTSAIQWLNTK